MISTRVSTSSDIGKERQIERFCDGNRQWLSGVGRVFRNVLHSSATTDLPILRYRPALLT
ncbi:hypothetical protein ANCCAN_29725, partial [Ancylostoma caninum]